MSKVALVNMVQDITAEAQTQEVIAAAQNHRKFYMCTDKGEYLLIETKGHKCFISPQGYCRGTLAVRYLEKVAGKPVLYECTLKFETFVGILSASASKPAYEILATYVKENCTRLAS
ncbi:hypothetical protein A3K34_01045 [candidate division WWE3 bacterium RIFOXYC1_FULL_40_10]|uniref:Uncharacterized protein n=1 Tax=candidate division WWE3 bacterium RIFOXYA2_FULL_46_9 TaxID=1802636 RepID=A0A1F4W202_UNCKA|nr:MAG: hypothetical protein A3K58_01045 [candidate division WWE3 bacterium RIFOXYB1_FULL_40_22]OGC61456.1 MAG: hypothetical protein A3K37_01045 [candidate division WWE3 bacterium RIFOXYA1_FULL_40_11]OGC63390.1 MAG: hypothetical protein A2264_01520 [candidate division WWE3 bacterium RIFOXYA2_FULL_46_9]OGC64458.1 MAG: hypothetical protein A2326_00320 [candidate division WWE3 bacterium RIFOXYB2_FULL_41_6]OGC65839.1 MAG: hypothetical protein A3K34_01045 [candidate division WWE3 bacterium RIFOXYC1_